MQFSGPWSSSFLLVLWHHCVVVFFSYFFFARLHASENHFPHSSSHGFYPRNSNKIYINWVSVIQHDNSFLLHHLHCLIRGQKLRRQKLEVAHCSCAHLFPILASVSQCAEQTCLRPLLFCIPLNPIDFILTFLIYFCSLSRPYLWLIPRLICELGFNPCRGLSFTLHACHFPHSSGFLLYHFTVLFSIHYLFIRHPHSRLPKLLVCSFCIQPAKVRPLFITGNQTSWIFYLETVYWVFESLFPFCFMLHFAKHNNSILMYLFYAWFKIRTLILNQIPFYIYSPNSNFLNTPDKVLYNYLIFT